MKHAEFVTGVASGRLRLQVDRVPAARFVAWRTLLPWLLLALFGLAVATALAGRLVWGGMLLATALCLRALVGRSAAGYVRQRPLAEAEFFTAAFEAGVLKILPQV